MKNEKKLQFFRLPFSPLKISNKRKTHKLKHIIQVWLQVQTTNTYKRYNKHILKDKNICY